MLIPNEPGVRLDRRQVLESGFPAPSIGQQDESLPAADPAEDREESLHFTNASAGTIGLLQGERAGQAEPFLGGARGDRGKTVVLPADLLAQGPGVLLQGVENLEQPGPVRGEGLMPVLLAFHRCMDHHAVRRSQPLVHEPARGAQRHEAPGIAELGEVEVDGDVPRRGIRRLTRFADVRGTDLLEAPDCLRIDDPLVDPKLEVTSAEPRYGAISTIAHDDVDEDEGDLDRSWLPAAATTGRKAPQAARRIRSGAPIRSRLLVSMAGSRLGNTYPLG